MKGEKIVFICCNNSSLEILLSFPFYSAPQKDAKKSPNHDTYFDFALGISYKVLFPVLYWPTAQFKTACTKFRNVIHRTFHRYSKSLWMGDYKASFWGPEQNKIEKLRKQSTPTVFLQHNTFFTWISRTQNPIVCYINILYLRKKKIKINVRTILLINMDFFHE